MVDLDRIAATVDGLRRTVGAADAERRGPAPLADYFAETGLDHVELPVLTRGSVANFLFGEGIPVGELGDVGEELDGFVFVAGRVGRAFVKAGHVLGRRRFTAAHELGHFLLHRESMGRSRADTSQTLQQAGDDAVDGMEREANRFAVELLMPADLCRARACEMRRKHGCSPRGVMVYRLSSELLVSREAMRYRLKSLGVGDE
jgi:hypothetical protein